MTSFLALALCNRIVKPNQHSLSGCVHVNPDRSDNCIFVFKKPSVLRFQTFSKNYWNIWKKKQKNTCIPIVRLRKDTRSSGHFRQASILKCDLTVVQSDVNLTKLTNCIAGTTTAVQHHPSSCLFWVAWVTWLHHVTKSTSLFSNSPVFSVRTTTRKRHFRKAPFLPDSNAVSVWTEGQTVEKKMRSQIDPD